jgi:hypothetical protein
MSIVQTIYYFRYETRHGAIKIQPESNGRFAVIYQGEHLGSYHSAVAAADDISGGHTFIPSNGVDFGDLDVPADLTEWEKKVFMDIHKLRPA